jgi:hypothetical protein
LLGAGIAGDVIEFGQPFVASQQRASFEDFK